MLISEIKKWHWVITWDNPAPANSSALVTALRALGNLTDLQTKTTWVLAPKANVSVTQIRNAIVSNMHATKGNVVYVNLKSGKAFQWGSKTGFKWRSAL